MSLVHTSMFVNLNHFYRYSTQGCKRAVTQDARWPDTRRFFGNFYRNEFPHLIPFGSSSSSLTPSTQATFQDLFSMTPEPMSRTASVAPSTCVQACPSPTPEPSRQPQQLNTVAPVTPVSFPALPSALPTTLDVPPPIDVPVPIITAPPSNVSVDMEAPSSTSDTLESSTDIEPLVPSSASQVPTFNGHKQTAISSPLPANSIGTTSVETPLPIDHALIPEDQSAHPDMIGHCGSFSDAGLTRDTSNATVLASDEGYSCPASIIAAHASPKRPVLLALVPSVNATAAPGSPPLCPVMAPMSDMDASAPTVPQTSHPASVSNTSATPADDHILPSESSDDRVMGGVGDADNADSTSTLGKRKDVPDNLIDAVTTSKKGSRTRRSKAPTVPVIPNLAEHPTRATRPSARARGSALA
jgi:hypothetical protein